MTSRLFLLASLASLLSLGCGDEGPLVVRARSNPGAAGAAGLPAGDGLAGGGSGGSGQAGSGGAGAAGAAGAGGDPGPPIRTVTTRSPFGHVQPDNLLWDGDFEWAGAFIQQYSWSTGKSWSTSDPPEIAVFPGCRAGMKCARLVKSGAMGGVAVSPRTATTRIRGWARVEPGNTCAKVGLHLSACFDSKSLTNGAKPVSDEPDADGWCSYDDERPTLQETPCLFVVNKTKNPILVDDLYLGPGEASQAAPAAASDPEATDAVAAVRQHLREQRRNPGARQAPRPPAHFPRVR